MAKTNEKLTPTESLLMDIREEIKNLHTTLGTGLLSIHEALITISLGESIKVKEPEAAAPAEEKPEPAAEAAAPAEDEIPKFLKEYVESHPGCKAADLVKEFKISGNKAAAAVKQFGKPAPVKTPPLPESLQKVHADAKKEVTVEMLRAKISEFAEAFSMNEALAVNEQFGGSRKVSGIPSTKYGFVYSEMARRLAEKAGPAAEEKAPTIDDVRKVAQPFVDKNGDPAFRALLKAVGKAEKISGVDPKFYPALIEALTNA